MNEIKCPVHHIPLVNDVVSVIDKDARLKKYSTNPDVLLDFNKKLADLRTKYPFSNFNAYKDDYPDRDSVEIFYCPLCRSGLEDYQKTIDEKLSKLQLELDRIKGINIVKSE